MFELVRRWVRFFNLYLPGLVEKEDSLSLHPSKRPVTELESIKNKTFFGLSLTEK